MTYADIDKTFLINLDECPERLEVADAHLKACGIEYERYPAIKHERGLLGLLATMDKIFHLCLEKGYKNVMILEDDNKFLVPDPVAFLNEVLPQLPEDYHCFYLSVNLLDRPVRISNNVLKIRAAYCSNAIIYSEASMKEILPLIGSFPTLAYDILLMKHLQQVYPAHCYCTFPLLSIQLPGWSSIENMEKDWGEVMLFTYRSHTLNL